MTTEQLLDETREANPSYLFLAQHLIRKDCGEALYWLGISEDVAEILDGLTTAQILMPGAAAKAA